MKIMKKKLKAAEIVIKIYIVIAKRDQFIYKIFDPK